MATGTIINTLSDPSGTPLQGVTVVATLIPGVAFQVSNPGVEITSQETTTTDSSGNWVLVLEQNTNINPGNSYWQIEEQIPVTAGVPRVWAVSVGAGTNSLYASLVSIPPASNPPVAYITQSSADARYQQFAALTLGSIQAVGTATQTGTATTAASSNHVHPLNPAVVGTGLTLVNGTIQFAPGYLPTLTMTATATASLSVGQLRFSTTSLAVYLQTVGNNQVVITPQSTTVATVTSTQTAYVSKGGPVVTAPTGSSAMIDMGCAATNGNSGQTNRIAINVSGATTIAAANGNGVAAQIPNAGFSTVMFRRFKLAGLTPGVNVFEVYVQTDGNTATFNNLDLTVEGLP